MKTRRHILVGLILSLAIVSLCWLRYHQDHERGDRLANIQNVSNLKNIGLAFRVPNRNDVDIRNVPDFKIISQRLENSNRDAISASGKPSTNRSESLQK
jgi:hypothetical protein